MASIDNNDFFQNQYKRNLRNGLITSLIFILLVVLASTLIHITGAVIGPGVVTQLGKNKSVQHVEGGLVKKIYVSEGDLVKAGDPLILLDSVQIESQLALLLKQQFTQQLTLDRLQAMLDELDVFIPNEAKYGELLIKYPDVVSTQTSVFDAQHNSFITSKKELTTTIAGLKVERTALKEQLKSNSKQLQLAKQNINDFSDLYDRQLISKSRLTNAENEEIQIETQIQSLKVAQVQTQNNLNDAKERLNSLLNQTKQGSWEQIEAIKSDLSEINASIEALNDQVTRLEITAPVNGRIHELIINNINAVIQPGEVILHIVPSDGDMLIHARVTPTDIDQIYLGQEVRIRFDAFDAQVTPEIKGKVLLISPDTTLDPATELEYYLVHVSLENTEVSKIKNEEIITGLPVTTMFTTNDRTIMNYLIKPLKTQLFSAFREN